MSQILAKITRRTRPLRWAAAIAALPLGACAGEGASSGAHLAGLEAAGLSVDEGDHGDSAYGDYLAGSFAVDSGRLAEAADYFQRALDRDPDNVDLLRQLFLLSLASGNFDAALPQAEKLSELEPGTGEAHLMLAADQARAGHFGAARQTLEALGDDGLTGLTAPFLDAWAIYGEGSTDATAHGLERLGQAESLGPLNRYHEAMMLYLDGQVDAARAALRQAMPEGGPASVRLVQAYAAMLADQGEEQAAVELVRAQLAGRGTEPNLAALLEILDAGRQPEPPFTDARGGMADALLGIAEALRSERGAARSVVYARLATFLEPDLAEGSLLIGDIMREEDNPEAAIGAYQAIGPDSPLHYAAQLRVASALHDLDRKDEAYRLLERLGQDDPKRIQALVQLGDLQRRDDDYAAAEAAYSRAIERIDQPQREHWTLYYARGICYERLKRWPEAEADFLLALELEPEQPFVLNYLGYSWVDQGLHLDRAKGMLNRAVELRPGDGYIVDSLGWVYYRLGEYDAAVDRLERAVVLEPGDPVINDHLGDAYWRVGRQREARFQWQRALTFEPEEDAVAAIEQKLKSGLPAPEPQRDRS